MQNKRAELTITQRINEIEQAYADKNKLVDEFLEYARQKFPITVDEQGGHIIHQDGYVTFLWRGNSKSNPISLSCELNNYVKSFKLKNIEGTNLYYLTSDKPLPNDLRTGYVIDYDFDHYDEKIRILEMPDKPEQPFIPDQKKLTVTEQEELMYLKPILIAKQLARIENEKKILNKEKKKLTAEKLRFSKIRFESADIEKIKSIEKEIISIENKIKSIEDWEERLDKKKNNIIANKENFPTTSIELAELQLLKIERDKRWIEISLPAESKFSGKKVWIHLPEGYKENNNTAYPLLLLLDGHRQQTVMSIPAIMDNMMKANKIKPTITILLEEAKPHTPGQPEDGEQSERFKEYDCNPEFTEFVGKELIDIIQQELQKHRVSIIDDPQFRIIGGFSIGGLAALYTGLKNPNIFGHVIAQSPAIWRLYLVDELSHAKPNFNLAVKEFSEKNGMIHFEITVGELETNAMRNGEKGFSPTMLESVKEFVRKYMADENGKKEIDGIEISFSIHISGHNYNCWQGLLSDSLIKISNQAFLENSHSALFKKITEISNKNDAEIQQQADLTQIAATVTATTQPTDNLNIKHEIFHSEQTSLKDRDIFIYKSKDFDPKTGKVVFMLDGKDLCESLTPYLSQTLENTMVVFVDSKKTESDYTYGTFNYNPYKYRDDEKRNIPDRVYEFYFRRNDFAEMLVNEIIPTYCGDVRPNHIILAAHSLAAYPVIQIAKEHPDQLGGIILLSPALNQNLDPGLPENPNDQLKKLPIYIRIGQLEDDKPNEFALKEHDMKDESRLDSNKIFHQKLVKKGYKSTLSTHPYGHQDIPALQEGIQDGLKYINKKEEQSNQPTMSHHFKKNV